MKTCPWCAEEIPEGSLVCPFCRTDLTPSPPPVPVTVAAGPRIGEGATRFSHAGQRYLLGYGPDFFGIWDRSEPGGPVERYARDDDGWAHAWNRFIAWEPRAVAIPDLGIPAPDVRARGRPFRSAHLQSRWISGLLATSAVIAGLEFLFRVQEIVLLRRFQAGTASGATLDAADNRLGAIVIIAGTVMVGAIVAWCLWQYRAQANLRPLGATGLRYLPGWAVGWWFIPVANFAVPYLAMRELTKASDPEAAAIDWKAVKTPALLWTWWGAWLMRVVFASIATGISPGPTTDLDRLVVGHAFLLASDAATIAAAVLAVLLIRRIDRGQQAKRAFVMGAWTPAAVV